MRRRSSAARTLQSPPTNLQMCGPWRAHAWTFYISARLLIEFRSNWRGCRVSGPGRIRAWLQACRKNALSPGFSRRCFPLCQPGRTTFGEPVPPDLSLVATFHPQAPRESTLDELHGSFSRTQDIFSRPPLRARSRPSQRLKPIPFRSGLARLKACPDTKPVIPKRAPKCRNSRWRRWSADPHGRSSAIAAGVAGGGMTASPSARMVRDRPDPWPSPARTRPDRGGWPCKA